MKNNGSLKNTRLCEQKQDQRDCDHDDEWGTSINQNTWQKQSYFPFSSLKLDM